MKNKTISSVIFLCIVFLCPKIYAENFPSQDTSSDTDFYGQVDALYPEDLRIIIGDISFNYNNKSLFFDKRGNTIINISRSIQEGQYIKYHISPTSISSFFIIDLNIISEDEFKNAEAEAKANDY